MDNWLGTLQPGDLVVVQGRRESLCKVLRVTKTQIICDNSLRYRRDTGRSIGTSTWATMHLTEATTEKVKTIRDNSKHAELVRKLSSANWRDYSLSDLQRIADEL